MPANIKRFLFFTVAGFLVFPLRAKENITIRLGFVGQTENPSTLSDQIRNELLREFSRKNPHISFTSSSSLRLKGQVRIDSRKMNLAGQSAPDIVAIPHRNADLLIDHGLVAPLDEYMIPWLREPGSDRYVYPAIEPLIKQKGHYYYIPDNAAPYVLAYRKDRFAEAGLTRPPETWDELLEWSRKLTDPATDRYGFVMYGSPSNPAWHWSYFLWQAGGSYFRRDPDGRWRSNLDTPEALTAARFFRQLLGEPWERDGRILQGAARIVSRYFFDEFRAGKAAMIIYHLGYYAEDNWQTVGIAPLPAGPTGIRATELSPALHGINASIKSKPHRDAVWKFLAFRNSDEAQYIWTRMRVESGNTRLVSRADLVRFGFERYLPLARPPEVARVDSISRSFARPETYGPPAANFIYEKTGGIFWKSAGRDSVDLQAMLKDADDFMDRKIMGNVPRAVMTRRKIITLAAVCLLGMVMLTVVVKYGISAFRTPDTSGVFPRPPRTYIWALLLMLPAIISILFWQYYPLVRGLSAAFMDYKVNAPSVWVGSDNFVKALWNPLFWNALKNTLLFILLTLAAGFLLPILVALVFQELPWGSLFFRMVFYIPAVTSALVASLVWLDMFGHSADSPVNRLLGSLGLPALKWHDDPVLMLVMVIIPGVWATAGAVSVLYQAALKTIPGELYEQADIDGASPLGKLWFVTLTHLKPLIIIQLVGAVIGAVHGTQRILVMTGGSGLTHTLGYDIFKNAFVFMNIGYATAVAWIMGALLIGFTVWQLRLLKNTRFTGSGAA